MIGDAPVRVAVEAAVRLGWDAVIGRDGVFIGMTGFGESGPYKELYKHFGITAEARSRPKRLVAAEATTTIFHGHLIVSPRRTVDRRASRGAIAGRKRH